VVIGYRLFGFPPLGWASRALCCINEPSGYLRDAMLGGALCYSPLGSGPYRMPAVSPLLAAGAVGLGVGCFAWARGLSPAAPSREWRSSCGCQPLVPLGVAGVALFAGLAVVSLQPRWSMHGGTRAPRLQFFTGRDGRPYLAGVIGAGC